MYVFLPSEYRTFLKICSFILNDYISAQILISVFVT